MRKPTNTGPKKQVKYVPRKKSYYTEEQMAEALKEKGGQIYVTANHLDISPQTVMNYIKRYPELKKVVKAAKQLKFQQVVGKAFDLAIAGNEKAMRYVLFGSPEGRGAGWCMGKVVVHKGEIGHTQRVEVQEISTEKAEQIMEIVRKNIEFRKQQEAEQEKKEAGEPAQAAPLQIGLKEMPGQVEIQDAEVIGETPSPLSSSQEVE